MYVNMDSVFGQIRDFRVTWMSQCQLFHLGDCAGISRYNLSCAE